VLIQIPTGGTVQDCPDPSIIRGQQPGDTSWYMYCATDPLNDADKDASGNFNFHLITMHRTSDLGRWTYVGDVFSVRPALGGADCRTVGSRHQVFQQQILPVLRRFRHEPSWQGRRHWGG
jgi:hypothetical protein